MLQYVCPLRKYRNSIKAIYVLMIWQKLTLYAEKKNHTALLALNTKGFKAEAMGLCIYSQIGKITLKKYQIMAVLRDKLCC